MNMLASFWIMLSFISACSHTSKSSSVKYILGHNDIVSVSEENDIPSVRKATVVIATKNMQGSDVFCTGSLIKSHQGVIHVITNHHCFAEKDSFGETSFILVADACKQTRVFFDFVSGKNRKAPFAKCLPGSLRTDSWNDIGVFQLEESPPPDARTLTFFKGDSTGRKSFILHHPARPGGFAKDPEDNFSLPLAALTLNDCQVLGPFSADDIKLDSLLAASLRHTCDIDHGSSGSALIDAETSQVIGINWGGVAIDENRKGVTRKINAATKADIAEAFLNQ